MTPPLPSAIFTQSLACFRIRRGECRIWSLPRVSVVSREPYAPSWQLAVDSSVTCLDSASLAWIHANWVSTELIYSILILHPSPPCSAHVATLLLKVGTRIYFWTPSLIASLFYQVSKNQPLLWNRCSALGTLLNYFLVLARRVTTMSENSEYRESA